MSKDLVVSEGVVTTDEGTPSALSFPSTVTVGEVTLTSQPGTIDSLVLNGQLLSAHDALYAYADNMQGNGSLLTENAQDAGLPRWVLADAATQRVKWVWEIPAEWDTVAVRFGWTKNSAGTGNVVWQFSYQLVYPFAGDDIDAGAMTDVALGAIAVPGTTNAFVYQIPTELSAISTPDGFIGSKPFLLASLSRLGADGADTYAAGVSVALATLTRTS